MRSDMGSEKLPCILPWKALFMDERESRLSAVPCCANWIRQGYGAIGPDATMDELWNGRGAREIRRLLSEGRQAELCQPDCPWLMSGRFSEGALTVLPGPPAFEENQRLNNREIAERKQVLKSSPMAIRIIPTLHCNIRCRMCHQDHRAKLLLPEAFMADVRRIGPCVYDYQLHGGEVLISRRLHEWVDPEWFAANPQMLLSLITNATKLPAYNWPILQRVRINYLTVSLNAATRVTYRYIMGANLFDDVIYNIIALRDLGRQHALRKFQVFLSFVIMRSNYSEVPLFVQLAQELGLPFRLLLVVGNRLDESLCTEPTVLREALHVLEEAERLAPCESRLEVERVQRSLREALTASAAGRNL